MPSNNIKEIVSAIAPINNKYRDSSTNVPSKVEALWEIGNKLLAFGVTQPHTVGWAVQSETKGLIKRSTVIRSYRVRLIWVTKDGLSKDLVSIKSLSNLFQIFPLIDPSQIVRNKLSKEEIKEIYQRACNDSPKFFDSYIKKIKQKYSHGQLGQSLDRSKHLKGLEVTVLNLRILIGYLARIIASNEVSDRESYRAGTFEKELRSFSNMCISLTTKENLRLYKKIGPDISESTNKEFNFLYNYLYKILNKIADHERARLRRLVSPEVFANISDMVSSLITEDGVKDFRARQKMTIKF